MNIKFVIFVVLLAQLTYVKADCPKPPSGVRYCPSEWAIFGEYCYQVQTNKKWAEAQSACKTMSANLVSIANEAENDFITDFATSGSDKLGLDSQVWTGTKREDSESEWKNVDGSTFWENWAEPTYPKPDNSTNCVVTLADKSDPDGYFKKLANIDCGTVMRAFVCKKLAIVVN